jgi:O-antigen ligase
MTRNLGQIERFARLALGALLVILAITGTIGIWGYLGLVLIGTAFVSFCPIYRVLGIKTCKDC